MMLTLEGVAKQPSIVTSPITLSDGEKLLFRPLESGDVAQLSTFLQGLSPETRRLSTFDGYDLEMAKELCNAINKYDKLRLVVESNSIPVLSGRIVGLVEFSFGLPEGDIERFTKAGYKLDADMDCRFGPTLSDDYQNQGLGGKLFPFVVEIARNFGKRRIILWGGVLADNERAIHFYEKKGFKRAGAFSKDGVETLDMILEL